MYAIEILRDGVWTADGLGDDNEFDTAEDAEAGLLVDAG